MPSEVEITAGMVDVAAGRVELADPDAGPETSLVEVETGKAVTGALD